MTVSFLAEKEGFDLLHTCMLRVLQILILAEVMPFEAKLTSKEAYGSSNRMDSNGWTWTVCIGNGVASTLFSYFGYSSGTTKSSKSLYTLEPIYAI